MIMKHRGTKISKVVKSLAFEGDQSPQSSGNPVNTKIMILPS